MTPHTPYSRDGASGDLHPGPPDEQLAFSYASGYLRDKTNPGNPGKLETDEKSGQALTPRNSSPRNSNPKHTCPSSVVVLRGRRCSTAAPGMHNGHRHPLGGHRLPLTAWSLFTVKVSRNPGCSDHRIECKAGTWPFFPPCRGQGKGWVGHLQELGNRAQETGCASYSPLWA